MCWIFGRHELINPVAESGAEQKVTVDCPQEGLARTHGSSSSPIVLDPGWASQPSGRQKQNGFSLIELLIVVAIILIIAAIAIPNLLRARIASNESSAVASVRTINTAMISYNSTYPTVGFAANLTRLAGTCTGTTIPTSATACLIDSQLASGTKSGYSFVAVGSGGPPDSTYYVYANPLSVNTTGVRSFCSVPDAVVRYTSTGTAMTTCAGTETPLE
jgi:type IV pilus assembly protein PilA